MYKCINVCLHFGKEPLAGGGYTLYIYTIHIHYTYTLYIYTIHYTLYNIHILKVFSCCPSTVYVHTVSLVYTTYCLWTFGGGFVGWVDFRFVCRV